ncbi:50S ribosomal protein L1 [Candidatus Woesearchaeota archaeon]|nr:50S ribosomal protein L1 [Candidatus Woesearchaeota archaeon]
MDNQQLVQALTQLREISPKRNFTQSVDLVINLKGLDLKKPENQVELYIFLQYGKGKPNKICALVGPELKEEAEVNCDKIIQEKDFEAFAKDKKLAKKLAAEFDFFIAQANIMAKVAAAFGRVFGPRRKMPNPKAGCVVPPKFNFKSLVDRLRNTIKVTAKEKPLIQVSIGNEKMSDQQLSENIMNVYNQVLHKLPGEKNNIKSVYVKYTMGKPMQLE